MAQSKKTMVIGASENSARYAFMAITRLNDAGHEVVPLSNKEGEVASIPFLKGYPLIEDIDTVTLYVGPQRQEQYIEYVSKLKPKRVIFNPGTINPGWMQELERDGVEVVDGCTLVMLSTGLY